MKKMSLVLLMILALNVAATSAVAGENKDALGEPNTSSDKLSDKYPISLTTNLAVTTEVGATVATGITAASFLPSSFREIQKPTLESVFFNGESLLRVSQDKQLVAGTLQKSLESLEENVKWKMTNADISFRNYEYLINMSRIERDTALTNYKNSLNALNLLHIEKLQDYEVKLRNRQFDRKIVGVSTAIGFASMADLALKFTKYSDKNVGFFAIDDLAVDTYAKVSDMVGSKLNPKSEATRNLADQQAQDAVATK